MNKDHTAAAILTADLVSRGKYDEIYPKDAITLHC